MGKTKRKVPARKYKVSTYVSGKLRVATVMAKNKPAAMKKASKKWGKSVDVGHWVAERV